MAGRIATPHRNTPDTSSTLQSRIARELIELRNKSVFAFLMFNALFVLVVFLLQLNKDQIHVKWPLGIRINVTYVEETAEVFTGLGFPLRPTELLMGL